MDIRTRDPINNVTDSIHYLKNATMRQVAPWPLTSFSAQSAANKAPGFDEQLNKNVSSACDRRAAAGP